MFSQAVQWQMALTEVMLYTMGHSNYDYYHQASNSKQITTKKAIKIRAQNPFQQILSEYDIRSWKIVSGKKMSVKACFQVYQNQASRKSF